MGDTGRAESSHGEPLLERSGRELLLRNSFETGISCNNSPLFVLSGLLQEDLGVSPDSGMEEDGLFCCPHDPFHIPYRPEEGGLHQADVLPPTPGLHLELR